MKIPTIHRHWKIIGYDSLDEKTGVYKYPTSINVVADNSEDAIETAKSLFKKKGYFISKVTDECIFESHNADLSLEIQKRMYKLLKKSL